MRPRPPHHVAGFFGFMLFWSVSLTDEPLWRALGSCAVHPCVSCGAGACRSIQRGRAPLDGLSAVHLAGASALVSGLPASGQSLASADAGGCAPFFYLPCAARAMARGCTGASAPLMLECAQSARTGVSGWRPCTAPAPVAAQYSCALGLRPARCMYRKVLRSAQQTVFNRLVA